jgi:aspartyl-tRNA(Asn)/glutamyl-tRNA(Gln) amidotransferase subunit C
MQKDEIIKISKLARIELQDAEAETIGSQFTGILEHIRKLDELDLSETEPVSHPLDIHNVFREDKICPGLNADELVRIAPSSYRGMIRVPKVIDK